MRIRQLMDALADHAPAHLAESWDASGLQVGDPDQPCTGIFLCLDVTDSSLEEALHEGANFIVSHHPLLFTPLKSLDVRTPTGRRVQQCILNGITVYSMHTNLDKVEGGMNDFAAGLLGLEGVFVLSSLPSGNQTYKLVTYVPPENRDALLQALFAAGGGRVGDYTACSFTCLGEGTFFPGENTSPVVGKKGSLNRVTEHRIEVLFPRDRLLAGVEALKSAHPYEVPVYDIYALTTPLQGEGYVRVGAFVPPLPWEAFLERIEKAFAVSDYRIIGKAVASVSRVALCAGSGASFIPRVARNVEVYITGDLKYHEAREAECLGLTVIDVGHFATERIFVSLVASWLEKITGSSRLKILKSGTERDPFTFIHRGGNH